jgi:hypothetical protein
MNTSSNGKSRMNPKKAAVEIKKLLDGLLRTKTYEEKKIILRQIKPFIEAIEAPVKKLKEEEAARKEKKRVIKNALQELISTFDQISGGRSPGPEFHGQVRDVIHHCFLKPRPNYSWPPKLGLDTDAQEERVRAALQKFLTHPEVLAASKSLKTPEDRLLAFQDGGVKTRMGSTCFDYFGFINKPLSREEVEKIKRQTQG